MQSSENQYFHLCKLWRFCKKKEQRKQGHKGPQRTRESRERKGPDQRKDQRKGSIKGKYQRRTKETIRENLKCIHHKRKCIPKKSSAKRKIQKKVEKTRPKFETKKGRNKRQKVGKICPINWQEKEEWKEESKRQNRKKAGWKLDLVKNFVALPKYFRREKQAWK